MVSSINLLQNLVLVWTDASAANTHRWMDADNWNLGRVPTSFIQVRVPAGFDDGATISGQDQAYAMSLMAESPIALAGSGSGCSLTVQGAAELHSDLDMRSAARLNLGASSAMHGTAVLMDGASIRAAVDVITLNVTSRFSIPSGTVFLYSVHVHLQGRAQLQITTAGSAVSALNMDRDSSITVSDGCELLIDQGNFGGIRARSGSDSVGKVVNEGRVVLRGKARIEALFDQYASTAELDLSAEGVEVSHGKFTLDGGRVWSSLADSGGTIFRAMSEVDFDERVAMNWTGISVHSAGADGHVDINIELGQHAVGATFSAVAQLRTTDSGVIHIWAADFARLELPATQMLLEGNSDSEIRFRGLDNLVLANYFQTGGTLELDGIGHIELRGLVHLRSGTILGKKTSSGNIPQVDALLGCKIVVGPNPDDGPSTIISTFALESVWLDFYAGSTMSISHIGESGYSRLEMDYVAAIEVYAGATVVIDQHNALGGIAKQSNSQWGWLRNHGRVVVRGKCQFETDFYQIPSAVDAEFELAAEELHFKYGNCVINGGKTWSSASSGTLLTVQTTDLSFLQRAAINWTGIALEAGNGAEVDIQIELGRHAVGTTFADVRKLHSHGNGKLHFEALDFDRLELNSTVVLVADDSSEILFRGLVDLVLVDYSQGKGKLLLDGVNNTHFAGEMMLHQGSIQGMGVTAPRLRLAPAATLFVGKLDGMSYTSKLLGVVVSLSSGSEMILANAGPRSFTNLILGPLVTIIVEEGATLMIDQQTTAGGIKQSSGQLQAGRIVNQGRVVVHGMATLQVHFDQYAPDAELELAAEEVKISSLHTRSTWTVDGGRVWSSNADRGGTLVHTDICGVNIGRRAAVNWTGISVTANSEVNIAIDTDQHPVTATFANVSQLWSRLRASIFVEVFGIDNLDLAARVIVGTDSSLHIRGLRHLALRQHTSVEYTGTLVLAPDMTVSSLAHFDWGGEILRDDAHPSGLTSRALLNLQNVTFTGSPTATDMNVTIAGEASTNSPRLLLYRAHVLVERGGRLVVGRNIRFDGRAPAELVVAGQATRSDPSAVSVTVAIAVVVKAAGDGVIDLGL